MGENKNFPEYHKIETLFERNADGLVDTGCLKNPVIGSINLWEVTEKIDGTNIRIMLSKEGEISFGGRTASAQLPADLVKYLMRTFTKGIESVLWKDEPCDVVLYGEGYGGSIQKGSQYRPDQSFILFDVLVGGKWWLDSDAVRDIAVRLGIEYVPLLGYLTLTQIIDMAQEPFASKIGSGLAEGIVARPLQPLFDKLHRRIIIKLKTCDFTKKRNKNVCHSG